MKVYEACSVHMRVYLLKTASQNSGPYLVVDAANIVLGHDRETRIDMSTVAQLAVRIA